MEKTLKPEELAQKKARYEELYAKDESVLTEAETKELLDLSSDMQFSEGKDKQEEEGKAPPEAPKKKYAGIYESVDDLLKGVQSSEDERKRIASELTEDQIREIEDTYKDSQRKVTKLVQEKKRPLSADRKPLQDRRLVEMTKEEYEAWEKENKLEAQSWLSKATALNEAQVKSAGAVFNKYPEFFAMLHGVKGKDKRFETYDRLAIEHPEWANMPNGPELAMEEMEKEVGAGKSEEKPKPTKTEEKPGFSHASGKPSGGSGKGSAKLSTEEFEALSPEEQRRYLDSQFKP